eukprot:SM000131S26766  [mRNA]  locus=s131:296633:298276:- [translate_table: standard]
MPSGGAMVGAARKEAASAAAAVCSLCRGAAAKYRCPRCDTRTCSARCVAAHKAAPPGCSGRRDRTAFVPLQAFTDATIVSDYKLLEEALQQRGKAKRLREQLEGSARQVSQRGGAAASLCRQARNRGTTLVLLAPAMSRSKANTSFYDRRRRCIFWRVDWVSEAAAVTLSSPKVDESLEIAEAFARALGAHAGQELAQKLAADCDAHTSQLQFLVRKEPSPANEPTFYKLLANEPLRLQLANKTVIEYPVVFVVTPANVSQYPLATDAGVVHFTEHPRDAAPTSQIQEELELGQHPRVENFEERNSDEPTHPCSAVALQNSEPG